MLFYTRLTFASLTTALHINSKHEGSTDICHGISVAQRIGHSTCGLVRQRTELLQAHQGCGVVRV